MDLSMKTIFESIKKQTVYVAKCIDYKNGFTINENEIQIIHVKIR